MLKKRILFITHDDTLTGAPLLLLNLINIIKSEVVSIKVIIKKHWEGGGLSEKFFLTAETVIWKNEPVRGISDKIDREMRRVLKMKTRSHIKIQKWINECDIVISNTITNGDILEEFYFSNDKKIISYVHELEMATQYYTSSHFLKSLVFKTNTFIVPSNVVHNHLVRNLKIPEEIIYKVNYYIPHINKPLIYKKNSDEFIVGLIGTLDWRKGADLLSVIILSIYHKYSEIKMKFIWQGANLNSIVYARILYELKQLGLSDKVEFLPSELDTSQFYQTIDVLLLTSKEDPYPLVVLEAASYKKPCICFENSGGAPEFVSNDAGDIVPFLNIDKLVDVLYSYYQDQLKCLKKGQNAFKKYLEKHNDKDLIISQLVQAMNL